MEPNENKATLSEYGEGIDGWSLDGLEAAELLEKMDMALLMALLAIFCVNPDGTDDIIEKIEEDIHKKYLIMKGEGQTDDEQQTENRA